MTCPECSTTLVGRFCHCCGWDSALPAGGQADTSQPKRPRWQRLTMAIILALCLVTVLWVLLVPRAGTYSYLNAGEPAPDFALQSPEGKTVHLSDYKGKAVILNFWASWCGPCRQEMPDLNAAYTKYGPDGLVVLAVNLSESNMTVKRYLGEVNVQFPIAIDENNTVEDRYNIVPLPTTYFIDRTGKIVGKHEGQMAADYINRQAQSLIGRQ